MTILRDLARADPRDNRVRATLADASTRMGDVFAAAGRTPAAIEHYDDAIRIATASLAVDAAEAVAQVALAKALGGRGVLLARSGQRAAAVADGQRQLDLAEQRYKAQPASRPALLNAAAGYAVLGRIHGTLGSRDDRAAACHWFEKSLQAYSQAKTAAPLDSRSAAELTALQRDAAACTAR